MGDSRQVDALIAVLDRALATSDVKAARDHLLEARRVAEGIRRELLQPEARPTAPPDQEKPRRMFRILVVDDEIAIGRSLARTLRNYNVVALDNARDVLTRLRAGERYDLILCDVLMPEMSGIDLYEETLRLAPDQARAFVFLTGGAVTPKARDFVATVPNVVLAKPFDINKLRDLVRHKEGLQRSDRIVMVVDDDETTRKRIVRFLTDAHFTCIERGWVPATLDELVADPDAVDVVLVAERFSMPEIDGISVLAKLQTDPATARIPVILLAAQAISETAMAWPVLVSNVRATCDRADIDRTLRTRLHLAEEHATRDALTGVMNRRGFEGRLAEAMANVTRHHEPLALVMIDLDHFKRINDVYGHVGGDRVLLYFARALRRAVRVGDQAFRYGGEEFALLLPKCEADGALGVVTRVQRDLRDRPISIVDDATEVVRFSAGIATAESKNDYQVQGLVTLADAALYKAKDGGRDRIEVAT